MRSIDIVLLGIVLYINEIRCLSPLYEAYTIDKYGMNEFAALHGMRLNTYHAITADNWRLKVHRVRSPDIFNRTFSTPVLILHGTSQSSADFMINSRSESLAFILADNGYDVWLGNHRGVQFSYEKVTSSGTPFNANGKDFYETAWQFMAEYDMPAFLDLILRESKQKKIHVVAHSQGASNVLAFFAGNHSFDDKIGHFVALAPSLLFCDDMKFIVKLGLRILAPLIEWLPQFLFEDVVQIRIMGVYHSPLSKFLYLFCYFLPHVCMAPINFLFQRNSIQKIIRSPDIDEDRLPVIGTIWPGGMTIMNLYEISRQIYMTPKAWTKIDYRKIPQTDLTNEQMYNMTEPPAINFEDSRVNMSFVFVRDDIFTGLDTARKMVAWLKPADHLIIDDNRFTHVDLTWSWKAPCLAYGFVLKQLIGFDDARGKEYLQYRRRVNEHLQNLDQPRCASEKDFA